MGKRLVIVESPAKIKTITKILGSEYKVMSTVGHIKDLPTRKLGITMTKNKIDLEYVTLEKKDKVIKDICKEAKTAEVIFLGPDPDREGELIAWHIGQEIESVVKNPEKIKRITFHEITKHAITDAIAHPTSVDAHKVSAQQARRVLDRWVGYEVSPVLWKKIKKGLSAGRVQSVALRLICDREEEIKHFKPEESWSIETIGHLEDKSKLPLSLTHIKKKKINITTQAQADKVVEELKKEAYKITAIADTKRSKKPAAPFTTSTLQQAAYQQLNFPVAKTMQLAQKLYEGVPLDDDQTPIALITYMRTDSTRISETAVKDTRGFIKGTYGESYLPTKPHVFSAKSKGQDAHEAIRPIDISWTPERVAQYVEPGLHKLYGLIWRRFVACQMHEAQYAQRKVTVEGGAFTLSATGSTLLFEGFLKVYNSADEEQEAQTPKLPADLKEGAAVELTAVTPKQHFTQPPARFSEASLVKEMEKAGIGRPSTYVAILKTIRERAYTELDDKKRFVPTELGAMVTKLLVEHLPKIMNISFTAEMETDLDKIAHGDLQRDKLLRDFYTTFSRDLASFKEVAGGGKTLEETTISCPSCGKANLVVRFGKAGPFLGCPTFPECNFTSNFTRDVEGAITMTATEQPALLEETCPQCGKQLRRVMGRFGAFTACSGYPECKYIHQKIASFPCPKCGGQLGERNWKGKIFWGCRNYPTCNFSISGEIVEEKCPLCSSPYLRKRKTTKGDALACPNKECGYTKLA
jgi:DNA topoisomerase-1